MGCHCISLYLYEYVIAGSSLGSSATKMLLLSNICIVPEPDTISLSNPNTMFSLVSFIGVNTGVGPGSTLNLNAVGLVIPPHVNPKRSLTLCGVPVT